MIGPASFVVNGSDLHAVSVRNELCNYYSDNAYLIIPVVNVDIRSAKLNHISEWAQYNNLKLSLTD